MPSLVDFLFVLSDISLDECNGNYQCLVYERVSSYCDLLSKGFDDLTMGEIKSIIEACNKEFNFDFGVAA